MYSHNNTSLDIIVKCALMYLVIPIKPEHY